MKILAVTACPTGIAHTYMAAEAIEDAAKKIMHKIQELHTISTNNPNIRRFSNSRLNVLILKVGNIRILFQKNDQRILIIDVINRAGGYR